MNQKLFGDRPSLNPDIWVVVNHTNKTIQYILNEGNPFGEEGSYMTLEYFTNHYKNDVDVSDYEYLSRTYKGTIRNKI